MKSLGTFSVVILLAFTAAAENEVGPRRHLCFDFGWKFFLGNPAGAQNADFDDAGWRGLDLPHDWSIEGPYSKTNSTTSSGGYLPAGTGWYRKHFSTPTYFDGKIISVQFDGVYMNATVFLNGHEIGEHAYGYTSFTCDLTRFLAPVGQENVVSVRVNNSMQPNSRWYSGSGIYRHVWLNATSPVHIATWGVYVTTANVSTNTANVVVRTRMQNETGSAVEVGIGQDLLDPAGNIVASAERFLVIPAKGETMLEQEISAARPQLWSLENPAMYSLRTRLAHGAGDAQEVIDSCDTQVGVRYINYTADRGFFLNGQHVKILGMCLHHDGGAVGAAVPIEIWERRLKLLKVMGCNAIRCSHNPPAPEFLDLCDRLGFLVMDEAFDEWFSAKGGLHGSYSTLFDIWSEKDLLSMLQRDRNHPSIVMWSIGNEIPDQTTDRGVAIAKKLSSICHAEDSTRPVTSACDGVHNPQYPTKPEFLAALDLAGYNYVDRWGRFRELFFSEDRDQHPQFKFLGTEDVCVGGVRGSYFEADAADRGGNFPFPYASSTIRAEQLWKFNALHDYVIGYFMWTGIDYLGEARIWPRKGSSSGVLDTCGFPKDGYYFFQSLWTTNPMVHVLPHWNYPGEKGDAIPVVVYSNCREVELFVNGKSYGTKSIVFPRPGSVRTWNERTPTGSTSDLHLTWDVPFEPGTLRVVGKRDGKIVAQQEIHTAGPPAAIALKCEQTTIASSTRGVAQIEARILDADGNFIPTATNSISFDIHGPVKIIGVDNGDPSSHDSYQVSTRAAFNGLAFAVVQAGKPVGHVTINVVADDLKPAQVEFDVVPGDPVPSLP